MAYLETVINVADSIGIDSVIIEPSRVRGMSEDSEIFILHTTSVPALECNAVGINRISEFRNRYNMVKGDKSTFDVTTHSITLEDSATPYEFARLINMQGNRINVDYRCSNPITIRSPKKLVDNTEYYQITDVSSWIDLLSRGLTAMGENLVTFRLENNILSFHLTDSTNDSLDFVILEDASSIMLDPESPTEFEFSYHAKALINILKKMTGNSVAITSQGMLKSDVSNLDVYIKPVV